MSEDAVQTYDVRPVAVTPLDLLKQAMDRGIDAESLRELMTLQREWKADQAREAFVQAMAAFKAEPLTIEKRKRVSFTTNRGTTEYNHATLAQVVDAVVIAMGRHGLSHRWETSQQDKLISVTCVITHELGHSERTTLSAAPDESGGKNSIQAVGSTVTYLQRYTLMAATGLAAKDMDDDGREAETPENITAEQIADLEALLEETGSDRAKFLAYAKVDSLDQILAKNYDAVCQTVRNAAKARQRKS